MKDFLIDLALPRTDAGAFTQAAIAVPLFAALLWRVWRHHEVRIFVAGLAMMTFAWFALRTVH